MIESGKVVGFDGRYVVIQFEEDGYTGRYLRKRFHELPQLGDVVTMDYDLCLEQPWSISWQECGF